MSLRLDWYRSFLVRWVGRWVLPWLCPPERVEAGRVEAFVAKGWPAAPVRRGDRAWFHAASVGELESLWTLILGWLRGDSSREVIVTVLSGSATPSLVKLRAEIESIFGSGRILYSGFCPWEGSWGEVLEAFAPGVFVTAKYEAWPELWASLAGSGTPLAIVGARAQRSLRLAKRLCRWMGVALPRTLLATSDEEDAADLRADFPQAEIRFCGEPRWDRVSERLRKRNPRATVLADRLRALPRPWLVLGSCWPEDLKLWRPVLEGFPGTAWVVPHRVEGASLEKIRYELSGQRSWQLSSNVLENSEQPKASGAAGVLVDEMGILSELYSFADLAYVGGGFGAGVHSTIEPALPGLPVSAGPRGQGRFPEIRQLLRTGQLTRVESSADAAEWLGRVLSPELAARRRDWGSQAHARLGASARVLEALDELLKACYP